MGAHRPYAEKAKWKDVEQPITWMRELFAKYVPPTIFEMKKSYSPVTPLNAMNYVTTLVNILEGCLKPDNLNNKADQPMFEMMFAFGMIWAFGGALCEKDGISYRYATAHPVESWRNAQICLSILCPTSTSRHAQPSGNHASDLCMLTCSVDLCPLFPGMPCVAYGCGISARDAVMHAMLAVPGLTLANLSAGRTLTNGGRAHGQQSRFLARAPSMTTLSTSRPTSSPLGQTL